MRKKIGIFLMCMMLMTSFMVVFPVDKVEAVNVYTMSYPTDDTFVDDVTNGSNGNLTNLVVRNDYGAGGTSGWIYKTLVKFNISSISSNESVISAKLKVFYDHYKDSNPSGRNLSLYRITSNWDEETTKGTNQPSYSSKRSVNASVPSITNVWMEWDVTNDVKDMVSDKQYYGWKISDDKYWGKSDIPEIFFRAKEHGNYDPYLEIEIADTYVDDDAMVSEDNRDYNHGHGASLRFRTSSGSQRHNFIKFNISMIPSGTTINSATLKFYWYSQHDGSAFGYTASVYRVTEDWDEHDVTWNNQPSYNPIATNTTTMPNSLDTWVSWDVTSDVQDFVDGTEDNYGWKTEGNNFVDNTITDFWSKEYLDYFPDEPIGLQPCLEIEIADVYVDDDAPSEWYDSTHVHTIQEGINNASTGDTVYVYSGTYYENVIINKTINLVGEDRISTIIDGGGISNVIYVSANDVHISGFTIQNSEMIPIFAGLIISSGSDGTKGDNCVISGNNISNNYHGVVIGMSCDNNIISDNKISSNNLTGIFLYGSNNHNNMISGNEISSNNWRGIHIPLPSNTNNQFYNNNLINNTLNAYDASVSSSIWDNGYPNGGNYWSDYDEPSEGAWDNNSDGIVDTPYNISGGSSQDRYPFMNPCGWLNLPPVSDPNGPYSAHENEKIVFDGSGSYDSDGYIVSYLWDFGDNNTGTGVKPTHKYKKEGTYIVNLTVMDDFGVSNYCTTTAGIKKKSPSPPSPPPYVPPNKKPKAKIIVNDKFEYIGVPIYFSGSDSYDDDGIIVNYSWDFGDGKTDNGENTAHAFSSLGSYKVTLTVTDDDGTTDEDTIRVIIRTPNRPPEMTAFCEICIKVGMKNVDYSFIAEAMDLDGDNISYVFNWSDESDLTITDYVPNGTSSEVLHKWSHAGIYPVVVYVIDDYNATSNCLSLIMLIDPICVSDLGYFFDSNEDGMFDMFFSNETETKTCCELHENGIYCIDTDGDEAWEYEYDSFSGTISVFSEQEPLDTEDKEQNIALVVIIGAIVFLLILAVIASVYKRKK